MQLLVGGTARACNVFLVCDDQKKTWKSLRCIHVFDLVLKFDSDTNGRNWLQLLLHFFVLRVKMPPLLERVFYVLFQVLDWSFLVLHFDGNVRHWIPKVIWPRVGWFWGFLFENGFFGLLHIFVDWDLEKMLNCFSFWRLRVFSTFSLSGIPVCSLKMLVSFNEMIL